MRRLRIFELLTWVYQADKSHDNMPKLSKVVSCTALVNLHSSKELTETF